MFESGKPNRLGKVGAGEEQQDAGIVDWGVHNASPVCGESRHAPMGPVSQFQGYFLFDHLYFLCVCPPQAVNY